jgi:hypothetical protein
MVGGTPEQAQVALVRDPVACNGAFNELSAMSVEWIGAMWIPREKGGRIFPPFPAVDFRVWSSCPAMIWAESAGTSCSASRLSTWMFGLEHFTLGSENSQNFFAVNVNDFQVREFNPNASVYAFAQFALNFGFLAILQEQRSEFCNCHSVNPNQKQAPAL